MAKLSYRERARARREQEILETAARLIREQGYSNLSMDGLSEEVGISKSTLYQHFRSKEEMVVRVLLKGFRMLDAHLKTASGSPIEQLEHLLRFLLTTAHAPDGFATSLVRDEVMTLFHHHPDVGDEARTIYARLLTIIQAGKQTGQIRPELPPAVIVTTMFAMLGILNAPGILHASDSLDDLIEHTVQMWLRGIKPEPPPE